MGIDAQVLIKVEPPHLSQTEIEQISYRLSASVGAGHFCIGAAKFDDGKFSTGALALEAILPWREDYYKEYEGEVVYLQSGPTIFPEPDEQFLSLNFLPRYYGPGYERGNWPILRATFALLAHLLPQAEIWYGGDSSGVVAKPIFIQGKPTENFEEIERCWLDFGLEPYTHCGKRSGALICPTCNHPCSQSRGEGDRTFYHCHGCGANYVTRGTTVWKGDDVFEVSAAIQEGKLEPFFDGKDFPQFFKGVQK